jgi:hypothetical protein
MEQENFGDILTPYIVGKLTGTEPVLFDPKSKFAPYFRHSIMTGSIIGRSRRNSLVWGSGIIKADDELEGGKFLAVRGPLTAKRLTDLGLAAPSVYGDPAILLPLLYHPKIKKKYSVGVIAHYADMAQMAAAFNEDAHILLIGLLTYDIAPVIDQIASCEKILSTSLHGLIVAHSYGIPAAWWKFSDNLSGDDVKFYDYFASVELDAGPLEGVSSVAEAIAKASFLLPAGSVIKKLQRGLLASFPYKIKSEYADWE